MGKNMESLISVARNGAAKYAATQLDDLKRIVSVDSGTRNEEGNAKVVEMVDEILAKLDGVQIDHIYSPGYGKHVVARLLPQNPQGKIIVNCHLDTVFQEGDAAKHPFRTEGDVAYGLGIADCKGGVVVSAYAVKIMQEAGLLPNKEIVLIYNCDEEEGTPTGKAVFDQEIPGAEMAFVFEPSRDDNGVLTSRKAPLRISIDVAGKKAHAGVNYPAGRSASVELAHKILQLHASNDSERGMYFNVSSLYSGKSGVNVVPDEASAMVGVRVSSIEETEMVKSILDRVEKDVLIDGCNTKITLVNKGYPMERNENNLRLYNLVRSAGLAMGTDLPEQSTGGSGDAGYFSSKGIPTVDALGPYMYQIHSTDESLRISSIEEKTALFCVVLGMIESSW